MAMDARKEALARQMPPEAEMAEGPEAAPAQAGPVPVEEVMAAMEQLRPQANDENLFDQALQMLAQSLGGGQTEQSAPTTPTEEQAE